MPDDELVRAEHVLEEAAAGIEAALARSRASVAEIVAKDAELGHQEAALWQDFAVRPGAAPEWHALIERIERGELGWNDVASGALAGDPDYVAVRAAEAHTHGARSEPDDTIPDQQRRWEQRWLDGG